MSRELSRIRSLVSEIDEIQRKGRAHPRQAAVPGPVEEMPMASVVTEPTPIVAAAPVPGRVSLSLHDNVIVELNIEKGPDQASEIVEIRSSNKGIEIVCHDGKAFHIPFKDVA